jgi:thiosulfate reductase/polysulfide reductase chain A
MPRRSASLFLALRQPAVKPMYNTKPGWWIARELGRRLGLGAYFPWGNIEDYLSRRLQGVNLSLAQMKKSGVVTFASSQSYIQPGHQFDTPSKKIEFYSKTLEQMGVDPVPRYRPHEEPPPGYFRLLYGRLPMHSFGRSTNNPVLASEAAENEAWISEATAAQLSLKAGQRIRLVNQDGLRSDPVKAKVTKRIRPDCVFLAHGFGHHTPRMRLTNGRGASDSDLITRYNTDPLMGATGMNVNFVTIEEA